MQIRNTSLTLRLKPAKISLRDDKDIPYFFIYNWYRQLYLWNAKMKYKLKGSNQNGFKS